MDHLRLAFRREGGGGGGSRVKTPKLTTSGSRLDTREVGVVEFVSKGWKEPPPARVWTRGRWWRWQGLRVSIFPGGKISNSKGMGMEDKNEPQFSSWLIFCDAPFASRFLPSLSSSFLSHFRACRRAHIPHERGGASCGRHSSGGGRRRRDTITKLFGCVNVIMCEHDHMTYWLVERSSSTSSSSTPPSLPPSSSQHHPQPLNTTTSCRRHLLHPCAPPSKDVGRVRNYQHIAPSSSLVDKDSPPRHQPNAGIETIRALATSSPERKHSGTQVRPSSPLKQNRYWPLPSLYPWRALPLAPSTLPHHSTPSVEDASPRHLPLSTWSVEDVSPGTYHFTFGLPHHSTLNVEDASPGACYHLPLCHVERRGRFPRRLPLPPCHSTLSIKDASLVSATTLYSI